METREAITMKIIDLDYLKLNCLLWFGYIMYIEHVVRLRRWCVSIIINTKVLAWSHMIVIHDTIHPFIHSSIHPSMHSSTYCLRSRLIEDK